MANQSAHSLIVSFHPVDHKVKFRFPWWILTESVGVPSLREGFVCSDHLQPGIGWGLLFGHFIIKGQHFADENIQLPAITRYRVKNHVYRKGQDEYRFCWLQQVIGIENTLARGKNCSVLSRSSQFSNAILSSQPKFRLLFIFTFIRSNVRIFEI